MNKRLRKKLVRNFSQTLTMPDGASVAVHVNRRGCTGRWTSKADAMLQQLVEAVHRMHARPSPLTPVTREDYPPMERDRILDARRDADQLFYPLGGPPERIPLADIKQHDTRTIRFSRNRDEDGARIVIVDPIEDPGAVTPLQQRIVYHSPTGLEFGYGGSGPADTALNILALVLPPREAVRFHQTFKFAYIARIPRDGGELHLAEVRGWIAAQYGEVRGWIAAQYGAELDDVALMEIERQQRADVGEIARLTSEADADERRLAETE